VNQDQNQNLPSRPIDRLKNVLSMDSVQEQFKNALAENCGPFVASLIDLYSNDSRLQQCEPGSVVKEALKAATLKLPINKSLGLAWIIPRKIKGKLTPCFQIGYKGYIQLAQRTGMYRFINADMVYEGERVIVDRLTGEAIFKGEPESDKPVGYFAHIETITGFRKTVFWTHEKVMAHAERYSPSFSYSDSSWKTNPNEMSLKTVLKSLICTYGPMSIEMQRASIADDESAFERAQAEVDENANREPIDITPGNQQGPPPPQEGQRQKGPSGADPPARTEVPPPESESPFNDMGPEPNF